MLMPNVRPIKEDTHYCAVFRFDAKQYVVGFTPKISNHLSHHVSLLAYPSSKYNGPYIEPNSITAKYWNCSEPIFSYENYKIIYGWTENDSLSHFHPPGAGYQIGGDSGVDYLVLQVHYNHVDVFKSEPANIKN